MPVRNVITDKIEAESKVYGDIRALQETNLDMTKHNYNAIHVSALMYNRSFW